MRGFGRWPRKARELGLGPALLILLLSVRVATAAAVDCQHELAESARSHIEAQELIKAEAMALGGDLCLVDAPSTDRATPASEAAHDGPHLHTPCPFFQPQAVLTEVRIAPEARQFSFSRAPFVFDDMRAGTDDLPAAYSPRAPPMAVWA